MNILFAMLGSILIEIGTHNCGLSIGIFLMVGAICLTISENK